MNKGKFKNLLTNKNWHVLLIVLCFLAAFGTIYALTFPAITKTNKTYCGLEEHTHTQDECYEKVLICGMEEGETTGHTHTDECYQEHSEYTCGYEEGQEVTHHHSDSCFDSDGWLACGLAEGETYTHFHDDSCLTTTRELICGQEEEAGSTHTHTDVCYENKLICDKTAHTHTLACQSNPDADTETADEWEKTMEGVNLSGVWADDFVAIAKTQLNYTESDKNFTVADDNVTILGYTRYGQWYGEPYGRWSEMFVSFCLNYADIPESSVPYSDDSAQWIQVLSGSLEEYKDFDLYKKVDEYTPAAGDIVFFDTNGDGIADAAGILERYLTGEEIDNGDADEILKTATAVDGEAQIAAAKAAEDKTSDKLIIIQGDFYNQVRETAYNADDVTILGFASLPENPDAKTDDSSADTQTQEDAQTGSAGGAQTHTDSTGDAKNDTQSQNTEAKKSSARRTLAVSNDVSSDSSNDEQIAAQSTNAVTIDSFKVGLATGATRQSDGTYVWTANTTLEGLTSSNSPHHDFVYRAEYTSSGVGYIEAKAFKITLPLHILKDRDNNYADYFDCAYWSMDELETKGGEKTDFAYEIDEAEGVVYIYNVNPITAGTSGYVEFAYCTTKTTYDYQDMKFSDAVNATLDVTGEDGTVVNHKATAPAVAIDTTASVKSVTKKDGSYPKYYDSWQSDWETAAKPDDDNSYYYLIWQIKVEMGDITQKFNLTIEDSFSDYGGSVVAYKTDTGWTAASDGKLTMYNIKRSDLTSDPNSSTFYKFVLVKYSKAEAYAALKASSSGSTMSHGGVVRNYTVNNYVTVTVDPADNVDADTSVSGSGTYTYEEPTFVHPLGHFWSEKFGYIGYNDIVESAEEVSSYKLTEYLNGSIDKVEDLKYYVYLEGYAYPWTVSGTFTGDDDKDAALYGKKPVTYTLSDSTFSVRPLTYINEEWTTTNVEGGKLSADDYYLDSLRWHVSISTAKYNSTTKSFTINSSPNLADTSLAGRVAESPCAVNEVYFYAIDANGAEYKAATYNLATKVYTINNNTYVSAASGDTITFTEPVKGYKIVTSNAYYKTDIEAYPDITLYRNNHVAQLLTGNSGATVSDLVSLADNASLSKIAVTNSAVGTVTQGTETLFTRNVDGTDYIGAVVRNSELTKSITSQTNDKYNKQYTFGWVINFEETYSSGSSGWRSYVPQESGRFYDLLPLGSVLDVSSLNVQSSAGKLNSGEYTYEVIENYQGTGQQMLILDILESTSTAYTLSYNTIYSWEAVNDYREKFSSGYLTDVTNKCAYETGNEDIGEGEPDNGTMGVKLTDTTSDDTNVKKFKYANAGHNFNILLAANTGLEKTVRSKDDTGYMRSTRVYAGESYTYRLRYANDSATKSGEIVFIDSFENYAVNGTTTSDWHGTLTGIDISQLKLKGIAPKVYVWTGSSRINPDDYKGSNDEIDLTTLVSEGWRQLSETDYNNADTLKNVTAIIIDATKTSGNEPFILEANESISALLYFSAPTSISGTDDNQLAYNNIYISRTAYDAASDSSTGSSSFYHQDYTTVSYYVAADIELTKVNAEDTSEVIKGIEYTLSGTSDYGTEVEKIAVSNSDGKISFKDVEKGTYNLYESACSSDWQLSSEVYTVNVALDGTVTIKDGDGNALTKSGTGWIVTDEPRIHGDLDIKKTSTAGKNAAVSGAEFKLSGKSSYGNEVLLFATSGSDGYLSFDDIELGTYTLVETSAPSGYVLSNTVWTVQVSESGGATISYVKDGETIYLERSTTDGSYEIQNSPYVSVQFMKTSTYGNKSMTGVEFSLEGVADSGRQIAKTGTSDAGGFVKFEELEPGTYVLKETKLPTDPAGDGLTYTVDETGYSVTISADGSYAISGLGKLALGDTDYIYNFPNTPDTGVVEVKKIWVGSDVPSSPDAMNVKLSTEEPEISGTNVEKIVFNANGGTFKNGKETNSVTYYNYGNTRVTNYKPVMGAYEDPTGEGMVFISKWYTEKTGGYEVALNENHYFKRKNTTANYYNYDENGNIILYARWNRTAAYAVKLYSLNGGTETENANLGLTFGPALGEFTGSGAMTSTTEYVTTYVGHDVDEEGYIKNLTETTSGSNKYRCIHNDSWRTIVEWNKKDPEVYKYCLITENGCTKSVPLSVNTTTTILDSDFEATYDGDGPSILYNELLNENLSGDGAYENLRFVSMAYDRNNSETYNMLGNWATSRIRAMLNGKNDSTTLLGSKKSTLVNNDANVYTSENCLFATLPDVLRKAIGVRTINTYSQTSYDSINGRGIISTEDKLWLLAAGNNETDSVWMAKNNVGKMEGERLTGLKNHGKYDYWLRSGVGTNGRVNRVENGNGGEIKDYNASAYIGVSFGFSLDKTKG